MTTARYDYGRAGLVGIGTPQANPTVEAEMAILLPPNIAVAVTRLISSARAPADRLRDYLLRLEEYLLAYDSLRPTAFGFACTASSYLVDEVEAERTIDACEDRFGICIITAAAAIARALEKLRARRIAVVSPYPEELRAAAERYWTACGFEVTLMLAAGDLRPGADTRGIYALGSADAAAALRGTDLSDVDAVLLSGTGMPSLPLIANWAGGVPILSSNLCLAAALIERLGQEDILDPSRSAAAEAWRARCRAATL